jgi:hypothetical protein
MKILLLIEKKWKTLDERIANLETYLADKNRLGSIYGKIIIEYKVVTLPTLKLQNDIYAEGDIKAITQPYRNGYDAVGIVFPVEPKAKYAGLYYPNVGTDYKLDFWVKAGEKTKYRGGKALEELVEHEVGHGVALDLGLKNQGSNNGWVAGADNTHFFFYGKNKDGFYKEINKHWKKKAGILSQTIQFMSNLVTMLSGQKKKINYFSDSEVAGLHKDFVSMLNTIRHKNGFAMIPTSTLRKDGNHATGWAVDIRSKGNKFYSLIKALRDNGMSGKDVYNTIKLTFLEELKNDEQYILVKNAIDVGVPRIGVYDRHTHLDKVPNKKDNTIWYGVSE